jgi:hypothetical protein
MDPLAELATWSPWLPFEEALETAPRLPGVYVARFANGPIVYVGRAGERAGGGIPKGIQGRLLVYLTGKGLASGLGEAALDRALADPVWLRERLVEVEAGNPRRAKDWGRAAIARAGLQVRWATTPDRSSATALETKCVAALAEIDLWNRRR